MGRQDAQMHRRHSRRTLVYLVVLPVVAVEGDETRYAVPSCRRPRVKVRWHWAALSNGQGKEKRHAGSEGADDHNLPDRKRV